MKMNVAHLPILFSTMSLKNSIIYFDFIQKHFLENLSQMNFQLVLDHSFKIIKTLDNS